VKGTRDGKRVVFRTAPRGAAAARVLASLAGQSAPATVFVAPAPAVRGRRPKRRAAPRLSSDPGAASRSAARFAAREAAAERRPPGPIAAAGTPAPHADRESGNNSAPASPQPRFRQELEDYLL
jgi:hypothetical protein